MHDWYKIFSLTEFLATGLVSRTYAVTLEGIGERDVLVTKGNYTGITYEDTFLPISLGDENPFQRDEYAVYLDENEDVWLGIEVES